MARALGGLCLLGLFCAGGGAHGVEGAADDAAEGVPRAVIEPVPHVVEAVLCQELRDAVVEVRVEFCMRHASRVSVATYGPNLGDVAARKGCRTLSRADIVRAV